MIRHAARARFAFLLTALACLLAAMPTAVAIESAVLHAPPADYQQLGSCAYYHRMQKFDGPILFYAGTTLTAVAYLISERAVLDGESVPLLSEFGGLPISDISFNFSQTNPFVNPPTQGRYYVLWMHIQGADSTARVPC